MQAGKKIRVTVYGGLLRRLPDRSKRLHLASIGRAGEVAGLTQGELEQALAKKFRSEYLKNPKVTVTVAEFRPFYIMGEIEKRAYPYTRGLNVLSAIAIAGGTTYRASKSTILIQRPGETACREYP